ncbi:2Fe-2S iron-sulfur cluster binding domain-containing protein [Gordonia sp. SID5947]|uniref:PDR/VanB family oxidoreductase n=1 Tax=Gordonia sp. SID5947 TaxID=2690315 RepID=UPI00136E9267|nr:PDR/VanB family oxidoreductase [Gordonia sp. SID5947]MYR07314.1 2Fe-2S iron-sulfur cluster binding domain-containing protein [Gordonia sp. SID5947]
MRVVDVTPLTPAINHYRLVPADGGPLTPFRPGSHVIVTAGEHRNAYSLVGDGMLPTDYGISVLRRGAGGGSDWLHENVAEGDVLHVEGPRSMFGPVWDQHHALLIAGGIGITPILSHARSIARLGGTADIVYSYRPGSAAHLTDVRSLAESPSITLFEVSGSDDTRWVLADRLVQQPLGTHAYACGPAALLDLYEDAAYTAGWVASRVHLERFSAPEQDPGQAFQVTVASTGAVIEVPSGVSLLQRLLDHGVRVENLCRQGVCGECRIGVRSGVIDHRDFVLSVDERAAGDTMLCCVSRGRDIEVDL